MENIKWSKKEVVERHHIDRWGDDLPNDTFKVNVYRWRNYRLEKELYGDNRSFYHLAKWMKNESANWLSYDLYLCDYHGSWNVCFYKNIKRATQQLQYILENGLHDGQRWADPTVDYVWNLLSYKPKRDKNSYRASEEFHAILNKASK